MPASVLSVSLDTSALVTRNKVISSAGYEVVTTTDCDLALELVRARRFDAVVIGHSIRPEQRHQLARSLREARPGCPVVMLYRTGEDSPVTGTADAYINNGDGPTALVSALRSLIRS